MSRTCRNMEDSGKHRFHGLEHDSKMRLFTTYSHTSSLRGYEASGKMLQQKTYKRRTKDVKKGTDDSREWRDRQVREQSLPQISEGNGGREKGKREPFRKIERKTKCESAGVEGGRVKNLASQTPSGRKNVPERATYETLLARAEWTSCPTLRGRRRNRAENHQENPPRKTELKKRKNRTKTNIPRRSNIQNQENRIKVLEGSGGLNVN